MNRRKVLLVEDNRLLRWWMLLDLYDAGFWVAAPDTPENAMVWADFCAFDILITDWRLPAGHNGIEMLTRTRAKSPAATAILMSAEMNEDLADQAYAAGFAHVLAKPFSPDELLHVLHAPLPGYAASASAFEEVAP